MIDMISWIVSTILLYIFGYQPPWCCKSMAELKPKDVNNIPGPLPLPLIGTAWLSFFGKCDISKIHEYYKEMYNKYGPIVKEEAIFNIPVVHVFKKNDIEQVLKCSGKYPIRPPTEAIAIYRRSRPDRYASAGFSNEQGEIWQSLRASLTPALTSPKTIQQFLPEMGDIAEDWCYLLKQNRDTTNKISNLKDLAGKLGLEAICALVLGRRMGFLIEDQQCEIALRLSEAVHQNFLACRDTYYGLPFWKLFPTKAYRSLAASEKAIYELASELIETADESSRESAVFQSVLRANVDEKEKRSAIVDFLASGIHTLQNSLLFLLYEVAAHPECQQKILEDTNNNNNPYIKACILETFRLLPTAFCLARVTTKPLQLSDYYIAPETVVICQTGIACQNNEYFPDAEQFQPERWLNKNENLTISNAAILSTPFGYGKRICPGKRYIEHVLPIILQKLVEKFELSTYGEPMELQFEFLLTPRGNVNIGLKERE